MPQMVNSSITVHIFHGGDNNDSNNDVNNNINNNNKDDINITNTHIHTHTHTHTYIVSWKLHSEKSMSERCLC